MSQERYLAACSEEELAEAREVLTETRALLANPMHWTRGTLARGGDGRVVDPLSNDARCWCLQGALTRVALARPHSHGAKIASQYALLLTIPSHQSLSEFGDRHNHRDVLAVLDRAMQHLVQSPGPVSLAPVHAL